MPNNNVQKFELPRPDWYDQEGIDEQTGEIIGRIYKDALIENFNAIEDKSLELQKLDVLDVSIPEPSGFVYNDSDLESSDNNQVINLRSLIKILNLEGYPIELSFSGTECTKCKFYKLVNDEVKIINLININTGASTSIPYIYIDIENENVLASANNNLQLSRYKFIGMYTGGKVIHQRSQLYPNSTTIKGS